MAWGDHIPLYGGRTLAENGMQHVDFWPCNPSKNVLIKARNDMYMNSNLKRYEHIAKATEYIQDNALSRMSIIVSIVISFFPFLSPGRDFSFVDQSG